MPTGVQLPLTFETRSLLGRDDFIVTTGTRPAVALIDSWPNWPAPVVAVFGPAGSGKSHLAAIWRDTSAASVINVNDMEATIDHLQTGSSQPRCCFVLEFSDDFVFTASHENALFHLLNTVREQQAFLLLISRQAPARFTVDLPDLESRLRAVPAVEIPAPDDDLLRGILMKMFKDRQLAVSSEVIDYLVFRMERSFDGARRLVEHLDRSALSKKRAITIPFVRSVIGS